MGIKVGGYSGGLGGRGRRSRRSPGIHRPIQRAQAQKPLRPIENPFPAKKEFRLGEYKIVEERDDYLVCRGYDPNTKNPFSEYTPDAPKTIEVSKPSLLLRTIWEEAEYVQIGDIRYTYEYSDDEYGVRTAMWTDGDGVEQEEEQEIDTPYFPDDVIVAVELRKSRAVDGIDVYNETGGRLSWVDLNISGRHWAKADIRQVEFKTGILAEDLLPATNALRTPSTAEVRIYELNDDGILEDTGEIEIVTCRYTEISTIVSGTLIDLRRHGSEWRPIAADCGLTDIITT